MWGNLVFIASFYFLKVSAYVLFLSSLTFVLNSIQHVRRMNAVQFGFFATVPVRRSLCYPLGITIIVNNNKLRNGHLCFVHPVPLQGGDVLSVTAVHHHLCYRYIPLQLWIKLNFTESTDPCLIHCLSLHLFWNAPWMRQRQEKWPVVM